MTVLLLMDMESYTILKNSGRPPVGKIAYSEIYQSGSPVG